MKYNRVKKTANQLGEPEKLPRKKEILDLLGLEKDLSTADILETRNPAEARDRKERNLDKLEKNIRKEYDLITAAKIEEELKAEILAGIKESGERSRMGGEDYKSGRVSPNTVATTVADVERVEGANSGLPDNKARNNSIGRA